MYKVLHLIFTFYLAQYVRAIPKLDNWSGLLEEISAVDAECRNFTQIFDSEGMDF